MRAPLLLAVAGALAALLAVAWLVTRPASPAAPAGESGLLPGRKAPVEHDAPRGEASLVAGPLPDAESSAAATVTSWPLHGRCVDAARGAPIPSIGIRVESPGRPVATTTTDEEGRFALRFEGGEEVHTRPLPRRGWVPCEPPVLLREAQLDGTEEIVLRLAKGTSAPAHGRVVDSITEEPVPRVEVTLRHAASELDTTVPTDDDGVFATELAFPAGELVAEVHDRPTENAILVDTFRRRHLEEGREPSPWVLPIDIGPTFFLSPAEGHLFPEGTWRARIVERGMNGAFAAVLACRDEGLKLLRDTSATGPVDRTALEERLRLLAKLGYADDELELRFEETEDEPRPWPWTPVREDNPRWARYPRRVHAPDPAAVPRLVLRCDDTDWGGETQLSRTFGRHPGVLEVPLHTIGDVHGRVLDQAGAPVPGAEVVLRALPPAARPTVCGAVTDDDGAFRFAHVPTGRHALSLRPLVHASETFEIPVGPGENALSPFLVAAHEPMGHVRGRTVADLEKPPATPLVALVPRDDARPSMVTVSRRWMRLRGRHEGLFAFGDVPRGVYDLFVTGHLGASVGNVRWEPARVEVTNEVRDLVLTARIDDRAVPHSFLVLDEVGFLVRGPSVVFGPLGWIQGSFRVKDGRSFAVAPDAPLRWMVTAHGRRPAWGTEADFARWGDGRRAHVELRPGWGMTLYLLRIQLPEGRERRYLEYDLEDGVSPGVFHGSPAVTGARILADGVEVGHTDHAGRIELSLPERPKRLAVDYAGLRGWLVSPLGWGNVSPTQIAVLWMAPLD